MAAFPSLGMKSKLYIIAIVLLGLIGVVVLRSHSQTVKIEPVQTTVSGIVKYVALSAQVITVTTTDSKEITLALDPKTALYDESGGSVNLLDIKPGMSIRADGTTTQTSIITRSITIVSRPVAGIDIANPCPGVISEENSGISCRLAVNSRITITLPSASFSRPALSIDPQAALSETFGASTQNDRWVRTFEALQPGKVSIRVPSKNKTFSAFTATLDLYGEASTTSNSSSVPSPDASSTPQP